MSHLEARQYVGATDLGLLVDFVRRATALRWPRRSYLHVGDVIWRLSLGTLDEARNIRLWIRDGQLLGFVWFNSPENMEIDALPELGSDRALTDEMLEWAERRRRELGAAQGWWDPELAATGPATALATNALDRDRSRISLLEGHDYTRVERHGVLLRYDSRSPIAQSQLPLGMRVRHVSDDELEERVGTHVDAWSHLDQIGIRDAKSGFTVERYRRLRAAPLYDPELDLVVETPEGGFAACCICWIDEANGVGFFEPVGTRARHRRQGLARAMILEGVRRLQARGAHTVHMGTASINGPAIACYQGCGFRLDDRDHWYVKRLPEPA